LTPSTEITQYLSQLFARDDALPSTTSSSTASDFSAAAAGPYPFDGERQITHAPDLLTGLKPDEALDPLLEPQQKDQEFNAIQKQEMEWVEGELAEQ
jgi:hypothetical protein